MERIANYMTRGNKVIKILEALGTMSEQKRKLIIWLIKYVPLYQYYGRDLTYQEISKQSGLPIGTTTRIMQELQDSELIFRDGGNFEICDLLKYCY